MTTVERPSFCIVAGEASGDRLAALLVREIQRLRPDATWAGIGGPDLAAIGVGLWETTDTMAVMGFTDVILSLQRFRRILSETAARIENDKPTAVILVDYPGFNLRLARRLRRSGVPVVYYSLPQLWAWGRKRVRVFQTEIDKTIALFPFETAFLAEHGVTADYFGHPFADEIAAMPDRDADRDRVGIAPDEKLIGLLPGSRPGEIGHLLPTMLQAVGLIERQCPHRVMIGRAPTVPEELLRSLAGDAGQKDMTTESRSLMRAADVLITKSGTATTEATICGTPMVVIYRTGAFNYWLARALVDVPFIAMPNLIANRRIVPEFVQDDATPHQIAREATAILSDRAHNERMRRDLAEAAAKLGPSRAAARAAETIVAWADQTNSDSA